jgi:hypothetical protein
LPQPHNGRLADAPEPPYDAEATSHMRIAPRRVVVPQPKRGRRGLVGLALLGLAIVGAVAIGGHAGRMTRGTYRYSVAPVSAIAR